ncbi:M24 family metallopeptidase [Nitrospirillum sp. BR 11752]|uniref:M24 family metallopeptidase n=1 Tax=Nitrospirillum sp. BR 11752 TaxID=3104293 RepID=UPI002EBDB45E|nr:M24 family metallopeptidase [Nitrospirillum sp. BR 11752]
MDDLSAQIAALMADDDALLQGLQQGGPMNLPRAYDVMERFGVDGLVLGDPLNVFHALGYWPQIGTTRQGQPPTTFAILTRDRRQAPAIVTSHFIYYYTFVDGGPRDGVAAYLFQDAGDEGPGDTGPDGARRERTAIPWAGLFADRGAAPLTQVEERRRDRTDAALRTRPLMADSGGALVRALRDLGLWSGRLGYDHEVVRMVCERHERPGGLVPADNLLRWIRVVKSPLELALMRRGAQANAAAVDAVVAQVRAGANYRDLRRLFAVESARRGNRAVFMTIDRVSSDLPTSDTVRDGQSLFFDGVGHFQNYHGDYARTVFVGEPAAAAVRAADAAQAGWKAIREQLRPGLRFSEVSRIGLDTLRKTGAGDLVTFGPHSVGLMHTDEPGEVRGGFYGKNDLTLEENMILSVDCPSLDTGIGGSVHIEDLVVITRDGAEPIHPLGKHVITI